jgi:two-component system, cell cycle sensor histidine kinase and response regulator CckA
VTAPLRVLIVEDSPTDAKLVHAELRRSLVVEIERVDTEVAMRAALATKVWDLVISDWSMPSFSARGALKVMAELGLDLPFIIVSGTVGEEAAVEAMRAGAHDYVLKNSLMRLGPVIERELREAELRRQAREGAAELRKQDHRFHALIDRSADGMSMTDAAGVLTYVSPAMAAIFGYAPHEMVGRPVLDMIRPVDREHVELDMRAVRGSSPRVATRELHVTRRDGSTCWIEARTTNLLDDPDVHAVVGNVRDITERRQMIELLHSSSVRYRRIVETTNEGIWMIDAAAKITYVNARMAEMLGRVGDDLEGRVLYEVLDGGLREHVERQAKHGVDSAGQCDSQIHRPDGQRLDCIVETSAIFDDDRHYTGTLGMVMDVTKRRLAEAALRTSEQRFARVAESGFLAIAIASLDGLIEEANDTYLRMLGYTRDDLREKKISWLSIVGEISPEENAAFMGALGDRGLLDPFERELVRKDGSRVFALCGAATLEDNRLAVFVADLTAQKRAEAALKHSEEQLRQAQKMEAMGRLAGGVAHDFNNLLSVILSYSEMLVEEQDLPPLARADIEEIRLASIRATDLTKQLLTFSRQQVIETSVISVNELLVSVDRMLHRIVGEDVDLRAVQAPDLGNVHADRSQLEQVIMNLVVNARDAMPRGGKLTIETSNAVLDEEYASSHHGVTAGSYVMLAVTDTGSGMTKETILRIFEPFFTTKEAGKGTGLGLAMVFGIVKNSGGSVWVYSEVGIGTTFKIYLPRVDAPVEPARPRPSPASLAGTETILLVEDDVHVRTVAAAILRASGYLVVIVEDTSNAIEIAAAYPDPIHLLLTDVVMPNMSGPELAAALLETRPEMRVLCMSGYTDDSIVRHGVIDGNIAFLQKPLTPDALRRRVRDVLDSKTRKQ